MHYKKTIGRVIYALKDEHRMTSPGSQLRKRLWAEIQEAIDFYWSAKAEEFNEHFIRRLNRDFVATPELNDRCNISRDNERLLAFWRSYDKTRS